MLADISHTMMQRTSWHW